VGGRGGVAGRRRRRGRSGHGHDGEADEGVRVVALLPAAAGSGCHPRGAAPETVSDPRPRTGSAPEMGGERADSPGGGRRSPEEAGPGALPARCSGLS